ncbi:hypothetical protein [Proteiniphilum sp.]|uniref:hypothetical protein n=1 Tax=Proteiniphilum sp. TaxID=1926877 RepID=UPI002B1FDF9D|nr:hypothetical protein [Proteiniphilum sp.]MEA4916855.1 hypothetical protein [Proteiniphilum sp.]
MKILQITIFALVIALITPSCNGKKSTNAEESAAGTEKADSVSHNQQNRRRGPDYNALKQELGLSAEQEKQFDEVIEKYRLIGEANRASYTGADGKVDRVAMFEKMDEVRKQQSAEVATFLNTDQTRRYEEFIEKNSRKRPGYSEEIVTRIKTELKLDESQAQMLEAANKAFEKSFHDAHDFYHGNSELAAEYWKKYDDERKNVLKQVFTEAQYEQYLEIVKDITSPGKK